MQKKFLTGILTLAAVCLFAPSPAHAEDGINTYAVEGSYTISIPTTVAVDTATLQGTLSVTGTVQPYHKLDVAVTSTNNYQLTCGSYEVPYAIADDNKNFTYSAETTENAFQKDITVKATDTSNATVSGEYTDTLTFTMSCLTQRYCLTFDANGGTVSESVRWLENGTAYGELPVPTKIGYTFQGWYDAQENGTKVSESTLMPQNAVTVYAYWTANTYTVKYDSNNALHKSVTGTMADSAMTYDSGAGLSTCSFANSDTGAHFAGWNTNADGTGTSYSAGATNLTSENSSEITLYAQWTYDNVVKVRFEDAVGNMDTATQTVISQALPSGQAISWSIADLDDYQKDKTQWEHQWQTPDDNGAVNYTTENASHTTTIDIMRQIYYLDLNGQLHDTDGKYLYGGGNLIQNSVTTATAAVYVNDVLQPKYTDTTDYFIQQRYGSTFKFVIKPQPGYKFIGTVTDAEQPLANVQYTLETCTITGIVTGEKHVTSTNTSTGDSRIYDATTVRVKMQVAPTTDTTTPTEEEITGEVTTIATESLTEPIATAETAMKPKETSEES